MELKERAEEKRKELTDIVKGLIQNYDIQNKEEISSEIINHFLNITPPEMEIVTKVIMIGKGGINGGRSTKPGNIRLNWRTLLVEGSESILTVAGAVAVPWLIPLAGLVVCDKIRSILTIKITERHAVVIWTMWLNKDPKNCIEGEVILNLVNTELSQYNHSKKCNCNEMNQEELDKVLKDLEKMECIEEIGKNKWLLRERVEVAYK